jgi:DNA-binding LacI/PurR family transcriptional regulator
VTWGIDRTLPRVCFHAWNEDALHADVLAFDDQGGGWLASACAAAAQLLNVPEVTAVLAANDCAALGMCAALSDAHIPRAQWPPLIGFDRRPAPSSFVLTSLRLPWEEIGRTAADFLWERRTHVYRGQPRQRQVPMRLIHRVGTQGLAPV